MRSLLALILALQLSLAFAQPYQAKQPTSVSIGFSTLKLDDRSMHYAYTGDTAKPGLIFVHGTPGGWAAFEVYLANRELQKQFFMVSVDRLGWGKSIVPDAGVKPELEVQARAITQVMREYPEKQWLVVGHSLGASIAPRIAILEPQRTAALLLLAGSLKPILGKPRWYNRVANTWLVSKLIGQQMRNSNREIMPLENELTLLNKAIRGLSLPSNVVIMQGMKDKLVSPKNPAFAAERWRDNFASLQIIELPDEGHFLPWRQTHLIINTLKELAEKSFVSD